MSYRPFDGAADAAVSSSDVARYRSMNRNILRSLIDPSRPRALNKPGQRAACGAGTSAWIAALLVSAFSALPACGSTTTRTAATPVNPHPLDFSPEPESAYVPNDQVQLRRPYWLVYRASDGTHYMVPRPDGDPTLQQACAKGDPFAALLTEAKLCRSADSQEAVDRVNALSRDEALQVSTYLHAALRFEPGEGDTVPHALTSDIVDVCRTYTDDRRGALRAVCDRELERADQATRTDMAVNLSEEEVAALANRLNDLYGIK